MDKFLTDQVCLVTGGAQGIGWAISQALADHGAQVYVCDISQESLAHATEEVARSPWADQITLARCDVTDRAQVEDWITNIHTQTGRIDVLVNNAAFVDWRSVMDMPVESAERTMRVGYDGMVYGIKAVLPLMLSAGRGHIVNMGSSIGRVFASGPSAAYASVKAAIDGYTQMLQIELKGTPVHVTLVLPSAVAGTSFFRQHVSSSKMPRMGDFLPYVTPPQVAASVLRAIRERRKIVNIPGYLRLIYLLFALAPGAVRWLSSRGGSGQRDYGQVEWQYRSKNG
jgi:NAD(P)-dependent dehydrogenase (short-subunit alcohol dehydrogenase family)